MTRVNKGRLRFLSSLGIFELAMVGAAASVSYVLTRSPALLSKLNSKMNCNMDPVLVFRLVCGIGGGVVAIMAVVSLFTLARKHEKKVVDQDDPYACRMRFTYGLCASLIILTKVMGVASGVAVTIGCLAFFSPGVMGDLNWSKQASVIVMTVGFACAVLSIFVLPNIILGVAGSECCAKTLADTQFRYAALTMAVSSPITAIIASATCSFVE